MKRLTNLRLISLIVSAWAISCMTDFGPIQVAYAGQLGLGNNLIANPGAEFGTPIESGVIQLYDWMIVDGPTGPNGLVGTLWGNPNGFPTLSDPGPEPNSSRGAYLFAGGADNAYSRATQLITGPTAEDRDAIDQGQVMFDLTGWLGGYAGQEDNAVLSIRFLDAANATIVSASIGPVTNADRYSQSGLLQRRQRGPVPEGTRSISVELAMTRLDGIYNDGYADNLSLLLLPLGPVNIFEWEYVNPANHAQGKRPSAVVATDGYGLQAEPGLDATGLDFQKAYLVGANLSGALFNSANLTEAELRDANLTNSKLENGVYAKANFYQANLTGARLSGTFTRTNLSQANLTNADLRGANLTGASLEQAIFTGANITGANLGSTDITIAQLHSTASYLNDDFTGTHFVGADLSGVNLAGQGLVSTNFYAGKLVGANLRNANATYAEFVNADLSHANLTGANLTSGSVALANLSGANLTDANLSGANFIGTNLAGAEIRGANLSRIQFISYQDPLQGYVCGPKHNGAPCSFSQPILSWGFPTPVVQTVGTGITLSQLVSTASYAERDLSGVALANSSFNGANFAGFNLTNSNFNGTALVGGDFAGADARGASGLSGVVAANFIRPDGRISGFNLTAGQTLAIRDYDAPMGGAAIPIRLDQQLSLAAGATLRMYLDADPWDSEISFEAGIPVLRSGTLELAFISGIDVSSQIGRSFDLFDWTGVSPSDTFALSSDYSWDFTNLYTTGVITLLGIGSGASVSALGSPTAPEPSALALLGIAALTGMLLRARGRAFAALALVPVLLSFGANVEAAAPFVPLTKIGNPSWKPVDFQLFTAPATPFFETFGNVYSNLLPHDTPLATTYVPHPGPYDTELSENAAAAGYVSHTLFSPEALDLNPNGLYIGFMLVPDPGVIGSSRDFASGPVIPNSVFPIASNGDIWLDGVLVDRLLGADFFQGVGSRDAGMVGTSHLEFLQVIWHPWDDDLTVGPLGRYDFRLSVRDNSGSGWDGHMNFRVAIPGDYDYSGTVGVEDYQVWRANFKSTTNLDADGNDDHVVDAADYTVWRNNLGATYGSGSGAAGYPLGASAASLSPAVPEPSSLLLVAIGLVALRTRVRMTPQVGCSVRSITSRR